MNGSVASRCIVSGDFFLGVIIKLMKISLVAPVIEAFGSERIIFGSSPSSSSRTRSNAGNWYEIARESLAETGIEQAFVDNIFYANAARVYGSKTEKS